MRFADKVAVVTGAGQGIGEAYAKALAAAGASVAVADLNQEQGTRVAQEINDGGGRARAVVVDVSDPESAVHMATQTAETFGGIDYLVNNAAIYGAMKIDALLTVDWDYFTKFMSVNMNGALICSRACVPSMLERGGGAIVNQSSTAAWMGGGYYSIAKAAVNSITVCLASELGSRNIRVNAIAPGPTDTTATRTVVPEMYVDALVQSLAIKRLGQPEDLTGACLFLLSDDARWLTGQIIAVDGGQTVRI
jgi:3-oxoacyl-[acyl-carrier protein] reductase